ncbi:PLG [Mytilus edulis]|uniref:PLG n=1 Tax=Mytilus edulis TaxID=6550 RepID=A0A8S3TLS9_MYTED|nr:PLG [Mytilus edulis]
MKYPEFVELIHKYDFICLSESKTDDFDVIDIPGYKFIMQNRKKTKVKSGGIAFGYKEKYEKQVHLIETESKLVLWLKISSEIFGTEEDVLIGCIYIPPENSIYKTQDAINDLEQEFLNFPLNYKYILLTGDFNSRTSTDSDFFEISESHHDNSDNVVVDYASCLNQFNMLHIDCRPSTKDKGYSGTVNITHSGLICHMWSDRSALPSGGLPDYNDELMNFCRTPDKDSETRPWCYTTSPGKRWEYCDVPLCG